MKFTVAAPPPALDVRIALPHADPTPWRAGGTPQDRLARVAARRAFVELKQCFMRAAAGVDGDHATLLQLHVRQSSDVMDLWLLRDVVLESLPRDTDAGLRLRRDLQAHLDDAFPNGTSLTRPPMA